MPSLEWLTEQCKTFLNTTWCVIYILEPEEQGSTYSDAPRVLRYLIIRSSLKALFRPKIAINNLLVTAVMRYRLLTSDRQIPRTVISAAQLCYDVIMYDVIGYFTQSSNSMFCNRRDLWSYMIRCYLSLPMCPPFELDWQRHIDRIGLETALVCSPFLIDGVTIDVDRLSVYSNSIGRWQPWKGFGSF